MGTVSGAIVGLLLAGAVVYALDKIYGGRGRHGKDYDSLVSAKREFGQSIELTSEVLSELLDKYEDCF